MAAARGSSSEWRWCWWGWPWAPWPRHARGDAPRRREPHAHGGGGARRHGSTARATRAPWSHASSTSPRTTGPTPSSAPSGGTGRATWRRRTGAPSATSSRCSAARWRRTRPAARLRVGRARGVHGALRAVGHRRRALPRLRALQPRGAGARGRPRPSPSRCGCEDWEAEGSEGGASSCACGCAAETDGVALELVLEEGKPPVLQGDRGLSQKGAGAGQRLLLLLADADALARHGDGGRARVHGDGRELDGPRVEHQRARRASRWAGTGSRSSSPTAAS